ncbi:hypothetical protein CAEBREN_05799 [Caenorhabditis brenneri]|uniref:Uncharacterized protein n=1 Tax=Caenorhabditis brenneri TaxID=135651 RepID=G0NIM1_CAEBE|nr:hypothetical protein CAEBREN_05799 [Caenorhabditis brenneri]
MSHMIIGLFGMILSVWSIMASLILMDFKFDLVVTTCILYTSCITLCFSYLLFCSALTTLYIRLPAEEMPFSGVKFYVVFFAVFHLGVAVATVHLSNRWPIFPMFIIFSFFLCCDFYSCLFADCYMLCVHRAFKSSMKTIQPIDGIIYKVAVRRIHVEAKQLPQDGFMFDDELQIDDKWLEYKKDKESFFWS